MNIINLIIYLTLVGSISFISSYAIINIFSEQVTETMKYRISIFCAILFLIPIGIFIPIDIGQHNEFVEELQTSIQSPILDRSISISEINVKDSNPSNQVSSQIGLSVNQFRPVDVYVAVTILLIAKTLISYILVMLKLNKLRKKGHYESLEHLGKSYNLYFIDSSISPFTFGIFKKRIYIPKGLVPHENFDYLLSHEITHIKRQDVLVKNLMNLICNVNWFNPLVYLARKQVFIYMESSCDEIVTNKLIESEKIEYANLLLDVIKFSNSNMSANTANFSSKQKKVVNRVEKFMKQKNISKRATYSIIVVLSLLIIGISIFSKTMLIDSTGKESKSEKITNGSELTDEKQADTVFNKSSSSINDEGKNLEKVADVNEGKETVISDDVSSQETPLAEVESEVQPSNAIFQRPVDSNAIIICEYGCYEGHHATDFMYEPRNSGDEPIYAIGDGVVIENKLDVNSFGYYVVIEHDNGYRSLYGHMKAHATPKVGSRVLEGERIGTVGITGQAAVEHIHLELRDTNGNKVDPMLYID